MLLWYNIIIKGVTAAVGECIMMKNEFEARIGSEISAYDYTVIEYVYTNHPSIDDIDGKDQIANIYRIGGMRIIRDMYETAKRAEGIRNAIMRVNSLRDTLAEDLTRLVDGEDTVVDTTELLKTIYKLS